MTLLKTKSIQRQYQELLKERSKIANNNQKALQAINDKLTALRERCPHEHKVSVGGGESVCQDCGILID